MREKERVWIWVDEEVGENLRGVFGKGKVIRIYCINKTYFQLKKKLKQNNRTTAKPKINQPTSHHQQKNHDSPVTLGLDAFTEAKNLSKSLNLLPLDLQGPVQWSRQPINYAQHAQTPPAMKPLFETLANSEGVLSMSS